MTGSARTDWKPAASVATLRVRARILGRVRAFLDHLGALEVETPLLSHAAATDVHVQSLVTCYTGPGAAQGGKLYLHTSPEFPMKRLLAAGSEIAHAPEFDYVIINEDFDRALADLTAIVTAARLRYASQAARHRELFAQLGIPV